MAGKVYEGIVLSNKMQKTLVVQVGRKQREPVTGKIVSTRQKYKVHCEDGSVKAGDRVAFTDCRPLSREKRFRFLKLVQKVEQAAGMSDEVNV